MRDKELDRSIRGIEELCLGVDVELRLSEVEVLVFLAPSATSLAWSNATSKASSMPWS